MSENTCLQCRLSPNFLKISRSSEDESEVEMCKGGGQEDGEVDLK